MNPSQAVAEAVARIERGEIPNAVVPPKDCERKPNEGMKQPGGGKGHAKYPIGDFAMDHLRSYKPGEKTTQANCELVLEIMTSHFRRAMLQSEIVAEFARRRDREPRAMTGVVSAALYFLSRTGLIFVGPKTGHTQVWKLDGVERTTTWKDGRVERQMVA